MSKANKAKKAANVGVLVRVAGKPRLSLAQHLRAFDGVRHGGEAMAAGRVGVEKS